MENKRQTIFIDMNVRDQDDTFAYLVKESTFRGKQSVKVTFFTKSYEIGTNHINDSFEHLRQQYIEDKYIEVKIK